LEDLLIRLKTSTPAERDSILASISVTHGSVSIPERAYELEIPTAQERAPTERNSQFESAIKPHHDGDTNSLDGDYDVSTFLSVDEVGQIAVFGPTSALYSGSPAKSSAAAAAIAADSSTAEPFRYQLIANAAIERQKEHQLRHLDFIRGVPARLAMHLLDLHWTRQHHTFLLTYRPTFMRELAKGGPYCSDFLVNAVFACSSKFSERIEVRDDPTDPESAGRRFFVRCEELLSQDSLLSYASIPTVIGLLLLGSTFLARGLASKGWLFTGYALRMVYDLGLHLDCGDVGSNAEEIEIRRRVFWGAFICDKLQSLYLGRPVTIQIRDAHVSRDFMDTFEEMEPWAPCIDPGSSYDLMASRNPAPIYIHSVSVFQQFCILSKIMTGIINRIYFLGATAENTLAQLQSLDSDLLAWYSALPAHLVFEPWSERPTDSPRRVAPNVTLLHTTYNSLIILLHRPFISNGHLHPTKVPPTSWKRCTTAARNITNLVISYKSTYPLRKSPYLLSYALYVACTIHVHHSAATENATRGDASLLSICLKCLDELAIPNSGVTNPARIIRKLMEAKNIQDTSCKSLPIFAQFGRVHCGRGFYF
jgi:hypothetical protein